MIFLFYCCDKSVFLKEKTLFHSANLLFQGKHMNYDVILSFIRSNADEQGSKKYQEESQLLTRQLLKEGAHQRSFVMDSVSGLGGPIEEFSLGLASLIIPYIGKIIIAWIKSSPGRKVKIIVGSVLVEVESEKDLSLAVEAAMKLQENQLVHDRDTKS